MFASPPAGPIKSSRARNCTELPGRSTPLGGGNAQPWLPSSTWPRVIISVVSCSLLVFLFGHLWLCQPRQPFPQFFINTLAFDYHGYAGHNGFSVRLLRLFIDERIRAGGFLRDADKPSLPSIWHHFNPKPATWVENFSRPLTVNVFMLCGGSGGYPAEHLSSRRAPLLSARSAPAAFITAYIAI